MSFLMTPICPQSLVEGRYLANVSLCLAVGRYPSMPNDSVLSRVVGSQNVRKIASKEIH